MQVITMEQVKAAALNIVREVGKEYGYRNVDTGWWDEESRCGKNACQYTLLSGGERRPACLIGRILFDLGVPLPEMLGTMPATELFGRLEFSSTADVAGSAREALNVAQSHQDLGRTWFDSLVEAGLINPEEV
jgi:hypothetical protein